jgi:hypothetical protein
MSTPLYRQRHDAIPSGGDAWLVALVVDVRRLSCCRRCAVNLPGVVASERSLRSENKNP